VLKSYAGIDRGISSSVEAEALTFFFAHFVTVPRSWLSARDFLDLLLPLYLKTTANSSLSSATTAVAMRLLFLWCRRNPSMDQSREFYMRALNSVKGELSCLRTSSTDELLVTVLLLDTYDTIRCRAGHASLPQTHLDGALALIKHRGMANLNGSLSQRLLFVVMNRAVFQGYRRVVDLKDYVNVWTTKSSALNDPSFELDLLSLRILNIWVSLRGNQVEKTGHMPLTATFAGHGCEGTEAQSALNELALLDEQLDLWLRNLPQHWMTVRLNLTQVQSSVIAVGLYNSLCDVYQDIFICSVLNSYRWSRLLVYQMIRDCESELNIKHHPLDYRMKSNIADQVQILVDDICASISFQLGNRRGPSVLEDFKCIEYPLIRLESQNIDPVYRQSGPDDDKHLRTALGGFFTISALLPILNLLDVTTADCLRPGQDDWMRQQIKRVQGFFHNTEDCNSRRA
jgi:hypothetical protein